MYTVCVCCVYVSLVNHTSSCSCDSISATFSPPHFAVLGWKPAGEISTNDNLTGFLPLHSIPQTDSHESTKQKVAFCNKGVSSKQRAAVPVS